MNKFFQILKKINTNALVAGSAVFISTCALVLSIQEVRIMRTQQKATMYPYVTLGWTYTGEGFGIELKNSGNGLAKVNSYKVFNDSIYFREWLDVIKHYYPEAKGIDYTLFSSDGNLRNQMISPGETKKLFFLKWTEETRELERRIGERLKVSICYSSLLDESWIIYNKTPIQIEGKCEVKVAQEFGF
ncbi:MAG: hypothetical protein JXQ93_00910 [Flavobacteriaceae bacterium]